MIRAKSRTANRKRGSYRAAARTSTRRRTVRRKSGRIGGRESSVAGARTNERIRLRREGAQLGAEWRQANPGGSIGDLKKRVQEAWSARWPNRRPRSAWRSDWNRGCAFGEGALAGAGFGGMFAPLPLQGSAAAVLCGKPSLAAMRAVLNELEKLPLAETIVVAGNMPESWMMSLRSQSEATISYFPEALDGDVGRALGAKLTGADIVLFVDGEEPVPAETLARFLLECDGRLDVALTDLSDPKKTFRSRGALLRYQEFLNVTLGRPDLKMNTLATLPFALSRNALDAIGASDLAVPAKAHAAAVLQGLAVGVAARIARTVPNSASAAEGSLQLAAGDHFEAWRAAAAARGARLQFADRSRNRRAVGGVVDDADIDRHPDE